MAKNRKSKVVRGKSHDFLWIERSLVRDLILASLGPSGVMVYVVLAAYSDHTGHSVMAMSFLEKTTGLTSKTIRNSLRRLESAGLIEITTHIKAASEFQLLPIT